MAWALKFDGVNDYVGLLTPYTMQTGDTLEFTGEYFDSGNAFQMFIDIYPGSGNYVSLRPSQSNLLHSRLNNVTKQSNPTLPENSIFTYELEKTSTEYITRINSVEQFRHQTTVNVVVYGFSDPTHVFGGQIISCELHNGVPIHNWDATASSHGSGTPILTDTVGGNDATGVNMPTDGSAWLNLGGPATTITPFYFTNLLASN